MSRDCPNYLHMKLVSSGLTSGRRVRLGVRREGLSGPEAAALDAFVERQYADLFLQTDGDAGAVFLHVDKQVLEEGFHQLSFTVEDATCTMPVETKRVELVFIDEKDNLRKKVLHGAKELFEIPTDHPLDGLGSGSDGSVGKGKGNVVETQLAVISNEASLRPTVVEFGKLKICVAVEYLWRSSRGFLSSKIRVGCEPDEGRIQRLASLVNGRHVAGPPVDVGGEVRALDYAHLAQTAPVLLDLACKYIGLVTDPLLLSRHPAYEIYVHVMANLHQDGFADDLSLCESVCSRVAKALSTQSLLALIKTLTKDGVMNKRHVRKHENWLALVATCHVAAHKLHFLHHSRSPQPLRKVFEECLGAVIKMKPLELAWTGLVHFGLGGIFATLDAGIVVLRIQQLLQRTEVDLTAFQRCKSGPWRKPLEHGGMTNKLSGGETTESVTASVDYITACMAHLFRPSSPESVWIHEVLPSASQWILSRLRGIVCRILQTMFDCQPTAAAALLKLDGVRSLLSSALYALPDPSALSSPEQRSLEVLIARVELPGEVELHLSFLLLRYFHAAVRSSGDGDGEGDSLLWEWVVSGVMPAATVKGLCVKLVRLMAGVGYISSLGRAFKHVTLELCNVSVESDFPWGSAAWTGIVLGLVELSLTDYYGIQLLENLIRIYSKDRINADAHPGSMLNGNGERLQYQTPRFVPTAVAALMDASLRLKAATSALSSGAQTSQDDLVRCMVLLMELKEDQGVVEAEILAEFFEARREGGQAAARFDHILVRLEESNACKSLCSKLLLLRTLEGIGEDFHISMEAVKLLVNQLSFIHSPYAIDNRIQNLRAVLSSPATLRKLLLLALNVFESLGIESVTTVLTRLNLQLYLLRLTTRQDDSSFEDQHADLDQRVLKTVAALVKVYDVLYNSVDASNHELRHRLLACAGESCHNVFAEMGPTRLADPAMQRIERVWDVLESSYGETPALIHAYLEKERQLGLRRARYCALEVSTVFGNCISMCPVELHTSCVELSDKMEQGGLVTLKMPNCCIPSDLPDGKKEVRLAELCGNWMHVFPVHEMQDMFVCYALIDDGNKVLRIAWESQAVVSYKQRRKRGVQDYLMPKEVQAGKVIAHVVELDNALLEECCHRIHCLRIALDHPVWSAKAVRTHETSAKQMLVHFIGREVEDILSPQVRLRR